MGGSYRDQGHGTVIHVYEMLSTTCSPHVPEKNNIRYPETFTFMLTTWQSNYLPCTLRLLHPTLPAPISSVVLAADQSRLWEACR